MLTCIFAFPPPGGSVALGQVLVLGGLKVSARLGSRPKTGVPHSRLPCCSLMGLRARWGAQGKYR